MCDWCSTTDKDLTTHQVFGTVYKLCQICSAHHEDCVCITCGESLNEEIVIKGECSGCQQIKAAKNEKRNNEVLNGLSADVLEELTQSVEFDEDDYGDWMVFSQGNFTPTVRKNNRKNWLKRKLVDENGWDEETFNSSFNDIEYMLDKYASNFFDATYEITLKNANINKLNIVDQKGNIVVLKYKEAGDGK